MTPDRDAGDEGPDPGTSEENEAGTDPGTRTPGERVDGDENPFESIPEEEAGDDPFERMDAGPGPETEAEASDVGEAIVPKDRYCESCEHFGDPPGMRCTHPGTEIRELVDMEHVRVFNCPVVADRREMAAMVAAGTDADIEEIPDDAGED